MSFLKTLKNKRKRAIEQQQKIAKVGYLKQRKLIEKDAQVIADELGVSMEEAIVYILSQKKKEKRAKQFEQLKKFGKQFGETSNKTSKSFESKKTEKGKSKKYGIDADRAAKMFGGK